MLDQSDINHTVHAVMDDHEETCHRPVAYMPLRPFMARLDDEYADDMSAPECQVIGVRQWDERTDENDMPMLMFVVITSDGQGTLLPRVVPYVDGALPSV